MTSECVYIYIYIYILNQTYLNNMKITHNQNELCLQGAFTSIIRETIPWGVNAKATIIVDHGINSHKA